jgi:hypothetical protein
VKITASEVAKKTNTSPNIKYKKRSKIPIQKETTIKYTTLPRPHNANIWQQTWANMEQSVKQKLQQEMEKYTYSNNIKIANMTKTQTTDTMNNNTNYTRVEKRKHAICTTKMKNGSKH